MIMNNRILVIDDEENVRDTIRAMLMPRMRDTTDIDALSKKLFGRSATDRERVQPPLLPFAFEVDTAANGREGLRCVQAAVAAKRPYAALLVDMRMPGWDGLTTVQRIRAYDKQAEVVFITAYSDYAIRDIVARAGMNVSYHCKPFSAEEIQQLAIKSVYEWNKARQLEELMQATVRLREHEGEPEELLPHFLEYARNQLGAVGTLLMAPQQGGLYHVEAQMGDWPPEAQARACACAAMLAAEEAETCSFRSGCFCQHFDRFIFVALLPEEAAVPTSDVLYLFRLFTEQAQQALKHVRLIARMRSSEKQAAIGAALGMVAHDLRSPLGAIQAASAALLDAEPPDAGMVRPLIEGIQRAACESLHYIQDLLEFVRGGEPVLAFQPIPCRPLLEDLVKEKSGQAGRTHVQFEVVVDPDTVLVMDRIKIRRALLNLVNNALEALRDHPDERPPKIVLSGGVRAGSGWLAVTDNGPGLPPAVRNNLFELFVSVGKAGGTGLGLAVVKKFADAHHLDVAVDSSSEGTTFTLSGFSEGGS